MTPEDMSALHGDAFGQGWSAQSFSKMLAAPGALCECSPQGFVLARQVLDEVEVLTMVIAREARRQGHALRLLETLIQSARASGATRIFLEVADDNSAARALYAKAGFLQTGQRRGYYSRPHGNVDALLLTRVL